MLKIVNTIKNKIHLNDNHSNHQKITSVKRSKSSLHQSISFVLVLAQCFALLPVQNVSNYNVSDLKFKWVTLKMAYTLANMTGAITLAIMNFIRYLSTGMHFGDLVTVIYFSITILTIGLFVKVAYKWKDLSKKWLTMENAMRKYKYQPNLSRRFKRTTFIVMILALGEHILFITKIIIIIFDCSLFATEPVKTYFGAAFSQIFALTTYTHIKAIALEYLNILATFAWNFMDLFIMLMCASIAERFNKLINRYFACMSICLLSIYLDTKIHNEYFWKEIREDYNRLAVLCNSLDETINHLVSLSFMNNLFFICIQLFRTLEPITGSIIHSIYFIGSFGFLLARTAAVSMYASWINEESKVIMTALFDVSSEDFGDEANRLIQQVSSCPVAITGSNYFEVTRDLCLKVAGAIITFELVLLQVGPLLFNTDDKTDNKPFCLE